MILKSRQCEESTVARRDAIRTESDLQDSDSQRVSTLTGYRCGALDLAWDSAKARRRL